MLRATLIPVAWFAVVLWCATARASPAPSPSFSRNVPTQKIVLWHTQDRFQAEFLRTLLTEFQATHGGVSIEVEDIVDLSAVLLKGAALGALPDVVFAPADTAGLHVPLRLSHIPTAAQLSTIPKEHYEALTIDTFVYGEPVLSGNHLVFYYDTSLLPSAPSTWEELAEWVKTGRVKEPREKQGALGGWPFKDPYFFLPFLLSLKGLDLAKAELSSEKTTAALRAYNALATTGIVEANCGYMCATDEFYRGRFAYTINGEWAFEDTRKALGKRFGMAPLPSFQGQKMLSPRGVFALLFPNRGLESAKGPTLHALARWLQSSDVQFRYAQEARRFPVLRGVPLGNDAEFQALARHLKNSASVTPSPKMLFLWPALRKGINLFFTSRLDPHEATRVMLDTARAGQRAFESSASQTSPATKEHP